jgi:hypothetical protein
VQFVNPWPWCLGSGRCAPERAFHSFRLSPKIESDMTE